MLSAMGDQNIVQWYQDIAEELPDMAVFVYDDAQAFKRPINTSVYRELAKIPQLVARKYRTQLVVSRCRDRQGGGKRADRGQDHGTGRGRSQDHRSRTPGARRSASGRGLKRTVTQRGAGPER